MGWFDWFRLKPAEKNKVPIPELEFLEEPHGSGIIREINRCLYEFFPNTKRVVQLTGPEGECSFGVFGDPHGYDGHVEIVCDIFKEKGACFIVGVGDYAKYPTSKDSRSDEEVTLETFRKAAQTGLPLGLIGGNWDKLVDYNGGIKKVSQEFPNVIDFYQYRIFEGKNFNFVSNPYVEGYGCFSEGFKGTIDDIAECIKYAKRIKNGKPTFLLSHQPPLCPEDLAGRSGIDVSPRSGPEKGQQIVYNVIIEGKIKFVVAANMHEAGMRGVTIQFLPVSEDTFSESLMHNCGPTSPCIYLNGRAYRGVGSLVGVRGNEAKYKPILLPECEPQLVRTELGGALEELLIQMYEKGRKDSS